MKVSRSCWKKTMRDDERASFPNSRKAGGGWLTDKTGEPDNTILIPSSCCRILDQRVDIKAHYQTKNKIKIAAHIMIHDGSRNPPSQKNTQTTKQKRTPTTTTKKRLGSGFRRKAEGQTHRPRMDIAAVSRASRLHHLCCVKGESLVTYAEEHTNSRIFF